MASRIHVRDTDISTASVVRFALFGRGRTAGTDVGAKLSSPLDFFVSEVDMVASLTPGQTHTLQFNIGGALTGPTFTVTGDDPVQSHDLNLSIDSLDAGRHLLHRTGTSAATGTIRNTFRYVVLDDEDISLHGAGDEASNITLAATSRFLGLNGSTTSEGTVTETNVQVPVPGDGEIKFMAVRGSVSASTTADVFMRVNGIDTALAVLGMSNTTSGGFMGSNLVDAVQVSEGDLISFRYIRASGSGTAVSLGIIIGFKGDPFVG